MTPSQHNQQNNIINDTSIQRVSDEETMDRASSRSDFNSSQNELNNKLVNSNLMINLNELNNFTNKKDK